MKKKLILKLFPLIFSFTEIYLIGKFILSYTNAIEQKKSKFMSYYYVCNQWLKNINKGIKLENFFKEHGYQNIAVYGGGELGFRLCEELKNSDICIKYIVDHCKVNFDNIPTKILGEPLEDVDIIIVTAIYDYNNICCQIKKVKKEAKVISLEKILFMLA